MSNTHDNDDPRDSVIAGVSEGISKYHSGIPDGLVPTFLGS